MPDDCASIPRIVHFGVFDVDARSGELRKAGRRIALQVQPFRVLLALLERPGELVTRDQLRRRLWPEDTFVDFEHGLNAAIKRLRDALGDSADNPRFVETLPRRGYRFIAPVRGNDGHDATDPMLAEPLPALHDPRPRSSSSHGRRGPWKLPGLAAALVMALVIAGVGLGLVGPSGYRAQTSAAGPTSRVVTRPSSTNVVAVSLFDNQTKDPALESLGLSLAAHVIHAATRVSTAHVIPAPADPGDARPGTRAGSVGAASELPALLVSGSYYLNGGRLEVQARIVDRNSGRLLHSTVVSDIAPDDPREGLDRLGDALAGAVATHFDDFFGGLGLISHVPGLGTYNEYRAGLELFQSDYPRAAAHLERAIAAAPWYVPAHVVLLFAHWNQGHDAEVDALLERLAGAWNRLSPAERLLIEFMGHARAERPIDGLQTLLALEALAPSSLVVRFNLAQVLRQTNRPRAAVEAHTRLAFDERSLRHSLGTYRHAEFCVALHMLGEYERELQVARSALERQPGNLLFARAVVRALAALGRVDEAMRVADDSRSLMGGGVLTPGDVMEEAALELRAHGHRSASVLLARRAVGWHRERPPDTARTRAARWSLARALYLGERWDEARALFAELARSTPDEVWFTQSIGTIAARQGNPAVARAVLAELRKRRFSDPGGTPMFAAAGLAALLDQPDAAADLLREAFARGLHHGLHVHRDVDLESLREHPAYLQLVEPQG